jgi:hypothetical protein
MGKTKVQRASLVAFILCLSIGFTSTPLSAAPLPNCSGRFSGIMKPVDKGVRAAVVKYYAIKKLGPITIYKNREQVVKVKLWTVGVHSCLNAPGSTGAYVGAVPTAALSAVEVYVFHKPYPNPVAQSFLVLAKMRVKGWIVVAENTSP